MAAKFGVYALFCRSFHRQTTLQCRSSALSHGTLGRYVTSSVRNLSVGKNALTNLNDRNVDDDGEDDDHFSSRKNITKRSTKFTVSQKGASSVVRPSRYMFNSQGDSDNGGQWLKRTTSNKHKLDWYTKQLLFLMSENKVLYPILAGLTTFLNNPGVSRFWNESSSLTNVFFIICAEIHKAYNLQI